MKSLPSVIPALIAAAGFGLSQASATSLLFDFGPTQTDPAYAANSPAHVVGALSSSEITWNKLTADSTSLVFGDGTAATGISIDLGRSQDSVDTIDFTDNGFSTGLTGTAINNGVYVASSPGRDGIFGGSGSSHSYALGMRIDGLPAGTYTLFIVGRNSNQGYACPEIFYLAAGDSSTSFDFSTVANTGTVSNSITAVTTNGFLFGENYSQLVVTLTDGQSLYLVSEGTSSTEYRGFFNCVELLYGEVTNLPARVSTDPASTSVLEGATVSFTAGVSGTLPFYMEWRTNGVAVSNFGTVTTTTNTSTLTLTNVTTALSGTTFSLFASNSIGSDLSSSATLSVGAVKSTTLLSNIWTLLPGDRTYLATSNTERSIAYNPVTSNLLLVSRSPSESVIVLDSSTGIEKRTLNVSTVGTTDDNSFGLSLIAVADDGVVYAANDSFNVGTVDYTIYQWPSDSSTTEPTVSFTGDPASAVESGLRWGTSLAVRGAGAATQILVAPTTGTNVVLLQTSDGLDFRDANPPTVISVNGVPSGFAELGLAFGPGTNTFWAKTAGDALYLVRFDLTTGVGTVLNVYSNNIVPSNVRGIGTDKAQKYLAGVAVDISDNVQVYSISDLTATPQLLDQKVFPLKNANTASGGPASIAFGGAYLYALDCNNGIKAFHIDTNYIPPSLSISSQPANTTVLQETAASFSVGAAGTQPIYYQWRFNGTNIAGETNFTLTLNRVSPQQAGVYSVIVSNFFSSLLSSNATLTVTPIYDTAQMTNIWHLAPGDQTYMGTNSLERGIAYNPVTTDLLLVSRSPSESIVVLNSKTGGFKHFMNVDYALPTITGVSFGLNMIGVADDGVVYAGSFTVNPQTTSYQLLRWENDSAQTYSTFAFDGDPAGDIDPGLRWGDNIAVRGSGTNTQVLIAPASGTNVVLLRTQTGADFQNEIPPSVIAVNGVPSGFAQVGLAFGPGTNTFWAKTGSQALYLVQFDLNANTGAVLYAYTDTNLLGSLHCIAADSKQNLLGGYSLTSPNSAVLFDISNLATGPVLRDQELFYTDFSGGPVGGGTGASAFGGNYFYVLDSNNGIMAFLIDTNYSAATPLTSFSISSIATLAGGNVVLKWPTVTGHTYQVETATTLSNTTVWTTLGNVITATDKTTAITNTIDSTTRYYRIKGN